MESGFRDSVVSVDVTLGVAGLEEEIVTADEVVVTANTLLIYSSVQIVVLFLSPRYSVFPEETC